jgi:hypothetical protein
MIEDWHRRVEGGVPAYLRHAAKFYPPQLLSCRARFETTVCGELPKRYIALARLVLATASRQPEAARRALHMTRSFGVLRDQAVQGLALAQLYGSDIGLEPVLLALEDILDEWSV